MKLTPILVLNKIDRLVTQLKMSPLEAYEHLVKVLAAVNAVQGTFVNEQALMENEAKLEKKSQNNEKNNKSSSSNSNDNNNNDQYFAPHNHNVVFASGLHGWAFRVEQFASLASKKLGMKESALNRVLWGDYYYDPQSKK